MKKYGKWLCSFCPVALLVFLTATGVYADGLTEITSLFDGIRDTGITVVKALGELALIGAALSIMHDREHHLTLKIGTALGGASVIWGLAPLLTWVQGH